MVEKLAYTEEQPRLNGLIDAATLIPTREGWRKLSTITSGDIVFDENGNFCTVMAVSKPVIPKQCWKLSFSDGGRIVADENMELETAHSYRPWTTPEVRGSGNGGRFIVAGVSTKNIANSVVKKRNDTMHQANHRLRVAGPLNFSTKQLPFPPYTCGRWLAAGAPVNNLLTVRADEMDYILGEIEDELNCKLNVWVKNTGAWYVQLLKPIGSLNKLVKAREGYIPQIYINSDREQRLFLLQGLLDAVSMIARSVPGAAPTIVFSSTDKYFSWQIWGIIRSLGFKAICSQYIFADGTVSWRVRFNATKGDEVFRVRRRIDLLPDVLKKRSSTITVVKCEQVEPRLMKSLRVGTANRIFLADHGCVPCGIARGIV